MHRNNPPAPNHPFQGLALVLLGLLAASSGCAICPSPYDHDYGGFVTKTPRTDMRHGRVGSIFSDPQSASSEASQVMTEIIEGENAMIEGLEIPVPGNLDD